MKITLRADSVEIEGYVNAVGRDSRKMLDEYGYPFVEQIAPGTFGRALEDKKDHDQIIKILLNHKMERCLGDTGSNLDLKEDSIGLYAKTTITDPETIELARNKKLRGWSFGFYPLDEKEEYTSRGTRKIITELALEEVSLIDDTMTPVYAGTSVHSRADEEEKTLLIRASDQDAIYTTWDQAPEEKKPVENRTQPVDYRYYHQIIETLKGGKK